MSAALSPKLTRLDERVLDALRTGRAMRAREIINSIYGHHRVRNPDWDWDDLAGRPYWVNEPAATGEQAQEVREILEGLAHLGHVRKCRGGWWRLP